MWSSQFRVFIIFALITFLLAAGPPKRKKTGQKAAINRVKPKSIDFLATRPIVSTTTGQIKGIQLSRGLFDPSYLGFKGIPYAEPPVGKLRWKNPVPHKGWTGIRDGSKFGEHCPNRGGLYVGNTSVSGPIDAGGAEDCLFLNVYTPSLTGSRAVMVFIHGGSFSAGSGESWWFGPSYLVNDGVVLVTLNYRLGALGFLSTGDAAAQGNWGLKDQTEALRWVKKNIAKFGGNPDEVTIFGESAGSVSVNYQIISDMRRNLFKRAIAQSGSSLVPWAIQPNPLVQAKKLATSIGIKWTSNQDMVNKLRNVPFGDILSYQEFVLKIPRISTPFEFAPVKEPLNSPEPVFLSQTPEKIYRSGEFTPISMMIGSNSAEALFMVYEPVVDWSLFDAYKNNSRYYVPYIFRLNATTQKTEINEVATEFKKIYFNGTDPNVFNVDINQWVNFQSDSIFNFGIERVVRYHAKKSDLPIYSYTFSMDGTRNVMKHSSLLTLFDGAVHTDELFYLFDPESYPWPFISNDAATTARKRMVRMWTNFAKTGNPTPTVDSLITTKWPKYSIEDEDYLDIDRTLKPMKKRFGGRLDAWHDFLKRFNP